MSKRLEGLVKRDEDGVERRQFLAGRKTLHELKEHLERVCKIIRGKFGIELLPAEGERPCTCVLECKGCGGLYSPNNPSQLLKQHDPTKPATCHGKGLSLEDEEG
jgi:hypothetical protein